MERPAWLRRLLARITTPTKPGQQSSWFWFGRAHSYRMNSQKALSLSAVYGCVRFLTGNIAQLPWPVYVKKGNSTEKIMEDPAYWVLSVRANPELSAYNWRALMLYRALLYGNGYSEIQRDNAGRVTALWPIDNDRIQVDRDDVGNLVYRVQNEFGTVDINPRDMFHLIGMSDDGIIGIPVIMYAARSISLGISQEEYGHGFFDNSGVPSGVLEHPNKLSDSAMDRLRKQWEESYQGSTRGQQTLVLEEGLTYKPVGLPPEQAQFLTSRQHSVEEIARWFGVPPQKIQQLLYSNYNSMEHLALEVIVDTLMPWIRRFEQEADYKILNNSFAGKFCRMDLRGLMRGTHKDRAEYYRAMFGIGALSINEIRDKEELNPIEHGDIHLIPLNMAPLDAVAEGKLMQPQKQEPNPPEPTGTPPDKEDKALEARLYRLLEATLDEMSAGEPTRSYIIEPKHDQLPN